MDFLSRSNFSASGSIVKILFFRFRNGDKFLFLTWMTKGAFARRTCFVPQAVI
ncbi:hypothetical protein B4168_2853 [Anoxybacillus flavithermus]|nr:hypothetical protein B4168_2853 [Anoxybacillus flavithermus]